MGTNTKMIFEYSIAIFEYIHIFVLHLFIIKLFIILNLIIRVLYYPKYSAVNNRCSYHI